MAVNHVPLTPLTLLERTARIFPTRTATVYEGERRSYGEFYERVCRLANGLVMSSPLLWTWWTWTGP